MFLGIYFFNTDLNKSTLLRDEMLLIHYSPQIKQKIYSIGIFHVPVVTQFIVKSIKKNHKKSHF